jgi:MFS transporter, putative metabolite:H+ symporter
MQAPDRSRGFVLLTVLAAALGYFADIFDIVLFTMVGKESLRDLGLDPQTQFAVFMDWQMGGMLLGGLVWGVIGDIAGRRRAMFASIITYAVANLLNAGVGLWQGVDIATQYAACRLLAGFGLAGELGAAVALVSESVAVRRRGLATMAVASLGISGAIAAYVVSRSVDWRTAYLIGGGLGLAVLALRLGTHESPLYLKAVAAQVRRGSLIALVAGSWRPLVLCVLVGLPLWMAVGKLVAPAHVVGNHLGTPGIEPGACMAWCYVGLVVGDLASALLSQTLRSRRIALTVFIGLLAPAAWWYLDRTAPTQAEMQTGAFLIGVACGYWALFVTIAAELFPTNVRATAATLIPNLVRGAVPVWTWGLGLMAGLGAIPALGTLIGGLIVLALMAVWLLPESFTRDLDDLPR